jgi:hypothetical protein
MPDKVTLVSYVNQTGFPEPILFHTLAADVLQEGRLHERKPLLDSAFDRSSSFTDIADDLLSATSIKKLRKPEDGQGFTSAG